MTKFSSSSFLDKNSNQNLTFVIKDAYIPFEIEKIDNDYIYITNS